MEAATANIPIFKTQASKEQPIEELYEAAFPNVARFVKKMGGDVEDAKDVFHDALVIYQERCDQPEFRLQHSPEGYLLGIAKHLWIRKHHQQRKLVPLSSIEREISLPEDYFPSYKTQRLLQFLESAGQKCLDLLRAFYYQKQPLKQLVTTLGYANEHSLSVQKYKCLEKVRHTVKNQSVAYEDFLD